MSRFFWLSVILAVGLSGCGGGGGGAIIDDGGGGDGGGDNGGGGDDGGSGGGTPPNPNLKIILDDDTRLAYNATFLPDVTAVGTASQAGDPMQMSNMPATGTLDYSGYLELTIFSATAPADVDGIASMSIAVADQSISGSIDGFRGMVEDANETLYLVSYDGILAVTDGSVSTGANGIAAITIDIDGTLDNGLNVFAVDGTLLGQLNGTDGDGLRARGTSFGTTGSMAVTIDGIAASGGIGTLSAVKDASAP